jgi:dTDP-4-amino-4,6-dideoxygalactose transaminase
MTDQPIRLIVPDVGADELHEIEKVFATGYLTQGPAVIAFEAAIASAIGAREVVATTSATSALHLTLAGLGIGPGDDVLVPDFTFPATANVVIQAGAQPVLVDIDPRTFAMDPVDLARRITPQSKAVIPVHPFGLPADMDPIRAVGDGAGLFVIEDAACAIGATYHGRKCGTLGTAGCFSFHPRKAVTTGEGGAITTDDADLAGRLRMLRTHGGVRTSGRFTFEAAGFNYRLSDILAAVGIAQMRKLAAFTGEKQRLAARYDTELGGLPGVVTPFVPDGLGHVYQSYVVMLDARFDRDLVIQRMAESGIETTLGTYALHAQPFFQRAFSTRPGDLPVSLDTFRRSLTLPCYPGLGDAGLDRVVGALRIALAA